MANANANAAVADIQDGAAVTHQLKKSGGTLSLATLRVGIGVALAVERV